MSKNRLWANPWFLLLVTAGWLAGLLATAYFVADRPVTTVILRSALSAGALRIASQPCKPLMDQMGKI